MNDFFVYVALFFSFVCSSLCMYCCFYALLYAPISGERRPLLGTPRPSLPTYTPLPMNETDDVVYPVANALDLEACTRQHMDEHECPVPLPCNREHMDGHVCVTPPCPRMHYENHNCPKCSEPHLKDHKCPPCELPHYDLITSEFALYVVDVEYMPGNDQCVFGVVVRAVGANGTRLVYQYYLDPMPHCMAPHPRHQDLVDDLALHFPTPCTMVFWDGRNDCSRLKFPDHIFLKEMASGSTWGGNPGNYSSLAIEARRLGYSFTHHHAAQFETAVAFQLLVLLASHNKMTVPQVVNGLPTVLIHKV